METRLPIGEFVAFEVGDPKALITAVEPFRFHWLPPSHLRKGSFRLEMWVREPVQVPPKLCVLHSIAHDVTITIRQFRTDTVVNTLTVKCPMMVLLEEPNPIHFVVAREADCYGHWTPAAPQPIRLLFEAVGDGTADAVSMRWE